MAEKVADIEAGPTPPQISAQSLPTLERRSFFSSLFRTSKTPESTTPKQRHDPAKLAARKVSPEVSRTGARRPSAAELGLAARNASADGSAPGMRYSYQSNSSGALPQRPNSGSRLTQSTNDMSTVDRGLSFNMSGLVRNSVMLFRGSTDPQQPTLTNMVLCCCWSCTPACVWCYLSVVTRSCCVRVCVCCTHHMTHTPHYSSQWQRYEARRTNAKAAAMVERTIQFLNLITTPRKLDMLNPHDWEAANRRAVEVGEETFYEEEEEEDTGDVPMPKSAIKYAQALLFFFQSKAGVGLSYMWGWGLVINRLGTYEDGSALWSAPSFFKVHQFSAGLTFGMAMPVLLGGVFVLLGKMLCWQDKHTWTQHACKHH